MTTYSWPGQVAPWIPASVEWWQAHNSRANVSPLNGSTQVVTLPGARWMCRMTFPAQPKADRAKLRGAITRLNGQEHRMALYDFGQPQRLGTCSLSGVTAAAALQFGQALTLNGCGAGGTLLAGSRISVATSTGVQLVEVPADATANGSGSMAIEVRPMLRGSVSAGATVVTDRPTALFVLSDPAVHWGQELAGICPAVSLEWQEVFA